MKKFLFRIIGATLFLLAQNSHAWTPNGESVNIVEVLEWQDSTFIVFKLSSGHYCYILPNEKNAYALIMGLYLSKKSASVHCHDTLEDKLGFPAHRLHRIIGTA